MAEHSVQRLISEAIGGGTQQRLGQGIALEQQIGLAQAQAQGGVEIGRQRGVGLVALGRLGEFPVDALLRGLDLGGPGQALEFADLTAQFGQGGIGQRTAAKQSLARGIKLPELHDNGQALADELRQGLGRREETGGRTRCRSGNDRRQWCLAGRCAHPISRT